MNVKEITLENRYATKSNGSQYYPKDRYGNEYLDYNLGMISNNGHIIYPLTSKGKPRYAIDNSGNQIYAMVNGLPVFGVGSNGDEHYAADNFGNEFYPKGNIPAKRADGTPYYASASNRREVFPVDSSGNEYYLTRIDFDKMDTIPKRYAKSSLGDEIYPLRLTSDNNEEQCLLNYNYAVDRNFKGYYPKDGFKNEYYRLPTPNEEQRLLRTNNIEWLMLDRYARTNDGKIILPTINHNFFVNPKLKPVIKQENIIGRIIREQDEVSDFLTDVTDPTFKPKHTRSYKYKSRITRETQVVEHKPVTSVYNFVINPSPPFFQRRCFWIFVIVLAMLKGFAIWWLFYKNPAPKNYNIKIPTS